jgi:mono/diheme cytochrome c family protein
MSHRLVALLSAFLISASGSTTATAADAAKGKAIAQEMCARCHNIESGGAFKQKPPTFQAIAIYRTADDIWSRILSPNPHSNMPDVQWSLTPDQVQDLVAYITSLDETPQ